MKLVATGRALIVSGAIAALTVSSAAAQGCEPIRFTTPVNLGGQGEVYHRAHEWQFTIAYRRLVSNEWFVGTKENSAAAPQGESPIIRIHTFVADVAYAFGERYRLGLSVPVSVGSFTRKWADGLEHEQTANGIGDVSFIAYTWVL